MISHAPLTGGENQQCCLDSKYSFVCCKHVDFLPPQQFYYIISIKFCAKLPETKNDEKK